MLTPAKLFAISLVTLRRAGFALYIGRPHVDFLMVEAATFFFGVVALGDVLELGDE